MTKRHVRILYSNQHTHHKQTNSSLSSFAILRLLLRFLPFYIANLVTLPFVLVSAVCILPAIACHVLHIIIIITE